jgi:hypothetical protein
MRFLTPVSARPGPRTGQGASDGGDPASLQGVCQKGLQQPVHCARHASAEPCVPAKITSRVAE